MVIPSALRYGAASSGMGPMPEEKMDVAVTGMPPTSSLSAGLTA